MKTRIALGAAIAAAAALTTPALASAAPTTCSYNPALRVATITMGTSFLNVAPSIGGSIVWSDNPNSGAQGNCNVNFSQFASTDNLDTLIIKGGPGFENIQLSEGNHIFGPGATPEKTGHSMMNVSVQSQGGGDVIDVFGTSFDDAMSITSSGAVGIVDLDNDGDTDIGITAPSRINLHGGFSGNDRLAAMSVFGVLSQIPTTLDGGSGNDTLFGGNANDLLIGNTGDDFINSVGGGADVVAGTEGFDTAFFDGLDTVSSIEKRTQTIGKLSGSKKPLKGMDVRLPLAWEHPKAWKDLKSIEALVFDGAKRVGTVKLTPAGKVSASGKLAVTGARIGHRGKTVTATLGLKFAKALHGKTLSIDIAATDKQGHRQVEPAARSARP